MHTMPLTFLLVSSLLTGCIRSFDSEISAEDLMLEKLTIAEKMMYRYLERLKKVRINHPIDPNDYQGDLGVIVNSMSVYGQPSQLHVQWNPVQADSVQILRCMQKDLEKTDLEYARSGKDCPDLANTDFDKLTQADVAQKCGFIACKLVSGQVVDGAHLIDVEARNKAKYLYLVRPCYDNYMLVANGTAKKAYACGTQQTQALKASTTKSGKTGVVQRVCSDQAKICHQASQSNKGNGTVLNRGENNLPMELFDKRKDLQKEIAKLEEGIVMEARRSLRTYTKEAFENEVMLKANQERDARCYEKEDFSFKMAISFLASTPMGIIPAAPDCEQAREKGKVGYIMAVGGEDNITKTETANTKNLHS